MVMDNQCEQVQLSQVQGHPSEGCPPERTRTKREINQTTATLAQSGRRRQRLGTTCVRRSLPAPLMLARPGFSVGLLQVERVTLVARLYTQRGKAVRAAWGVSLSRDLWLFHVIAEELPPSSQAPAHKVLYKPVGRPCVEEEAQVLNGNNG